MTLKSGSNATVRQIVYEFFSTFYCKYVPIVVTDIPSIEYWRDVIAVSGCSRPLQMAPIDRSYDLLLTYCWLPRLTIAILELFDVRYHDVEIG